MELGGFQLADGLWRESLQHGISLPEVEQMLFVSKGSRAIDKLMEYKSTKG